jgi:MOSC domain-containing protein YiiM
MSIEIVSVNASKKARAVRKWPINDNTVIADTCGLRRNELTLARNAGVAQTHGQTSRSIYVYPMIHYEYWTRQLDTELMPGAFGEHLTVSGTTELNVRIGDHWCWGDALFTVSGFGAPNRALDTLYGTDGRGAMHELGFCGWYLKTEKPGIVPTSGHIHSFPSAESHFSVLESLRTAQKQAADLSVAQEE